jgi:hypothetical protein
LKDFNEKIWGWQLACIEKKKKRDTEIQEVFAAFHMVAIELVNRIHQYRNGRQIFTDLIVHDAEHMIETLDIEIQELILMINQALQSISIAYCHNVPYIHINDISNTAGLIRRIITIRYKNFSHDVKKRRVKKDTGIDEAMNELTTGAARPLRDQFQRADWHIRPDAINHLTMGAPIPNHDNEVVEPQEELQEEPHPHYDSDSDQSVASDIQTAIVASLQDS